MKIIVVKSTSGQQIISLVHFTQALVHVKNDYNRMVLRQTVYKKIDCLWAAVAFLCFLHFLNIYLAKV